MKVLLMYRDRDFDPGRELPAHHATLQQDLALEELCQAMADGDDFLLKVARAALLSELHTDEATVRHRQAILQDFLRQPELARQLYAMAVEAFEMRKQRMFGIFSNYPAAVLGGAVGLLEVFVGLLVRLRQFAIANAGGFRSEGLQTLMAMLRAEFDDDYVACVREHLKTVRFREGILVSAQLGQGNEGIQHVLRQPSEPHGNWLQRLFQSGPPAYGFRIHERDEAGARALSELYDCGINGVANALAQSADHMLSFFDVLRAEMAFYLGCLNLHRHLSVLGVPLAFPQVHAPGSRHLSAQGLYDPCLALRAKAAPVGNVLRADGCDAVVITGANQGGKSSLLRAVGLAQLLMQCGMFVPAERMEAELCEGLFTHYRREEDARMVSGKFDEELARMSDIADHVRPHALVLFNESFAATNDREGSEIARQIVDALLERRIKVGFVTHLHDFPAALGQERTQAVRFLRAERQADGTRTFKLIEAAPLATSFGDDLYRKVFGDEAGEGAAP